MGILAALVIGAIAGWLAGLIVRGAGFGLIGNIVIGIIGALVELAVAAARRQPRRQRDARYRQCHHWCCDRAGDSFAGPTRLTKLSHPNSGRSPDGTLAAVSCSGKGAALRPAIGKANTR